MPKWEDNYEIKEVVLSKDIFNPNNYIKGFKFIDDYIKGVNFDKEKSKEVINRYIEIEKISE